MDYQTLPSALDELTPEWVTDKLRAAGVLKDGAVKHILLEAIGDGKGFTGEIRRIFLEYEPHEVAAPASLILKSPNLLPEIRTNLLNLYVREYLFYSEAAAYTPLRLPRLIHGEVEIETEKAVLLLEDLDPVQSFDIQSETKSNILLVLDELAKLHAAWWEHPGLQEFEWLPSIDRGLQEIVTIFPQYWKSFQKRMKAHLTSELITIGNQGHSNIKIVREKLARHPQTLLHGDFIGNNLLLRKNGPETDLFVIDWQVCRRGRCMLDVAHFLALSVSTDRRRKMENELLRYYYRRLKSYGVENYSFDEAMDDYKLSILDTFYFTIWISLFLDFSSGPNLVNMVVERVCQIVLDHHT